MQMYYIRMADKLHDRNLSLDLHSIGTLSDNKKAG